MAINSTKKKIAPLGLRMASTTHQEKKGIEVVNHIANNWRCDWQEFDHTNDDGIDGILIMRKGHINPSTTGGIIYVQVKCGKGYRIRNNSKPDKISINLGRLYIEKHRPRWKKIPGRVILIYRKSPDSIKSWWVDLNSDESYSDSNKAAIDIPKGQVFNTAQKGVFLKLSGRDTRYRDIDGIHVDRKREFIPRIGNGSGDFKQQAWSYFKLWKNQCQGIEKSSIPELGGVLINRTGWKHITRRGRLPERIFQSWTLLATARIMIQECKKFYRLGGSAEEIKDGKVTGLTDFIALRANVSYTHKDISIVQVVLKRYRPISANPGKKQKVWFYSVHELRRGK